ncbi:DUF3027 domain-containing protein [Rarobacter faecitabidus]|nr:DUF3027 domain-containing protein [Rarobacter faecitabidus]
MGAVDVARAAAIETADHPEDVAEHVDAVTIDERLVVHRFASGLKGYAGWQWNVVLARAPRARTATICEVTLLPGERALLAPEWLPWAERLRPSDIGPGHVLPFLADDPRLVPGYTPTGDEDEDFVAIEELALARARVLSPEGRLEAANRWYESDRGPATPIAIHSSAPCGDCGFLVPLQGSLGQIFGVCANAWSPEDGRVVSLDHGCGAHSETDAPVPASQWPSPSPVLDEVSIDVEVRRDLAGEGDSVDESSVAETQEAASGTNS